MTAGFSNISSFRPYFRPTVLTVLIGLNIALSAVIAGAGLLSDESLHSACGMLCLSDNPSVVAGRPWTAISYAFTNGNLLQLVFNMLWFYCFGRLLLLHVRARVIALIYLAAAVCGALAFVAFYPMVASPSAPSMLMGSSASVIAVAVAVAFIMPDTELMLPLFGNVRIKWITTVVVILFGIGLTSDNAGGNLAHLSGALAGAVAGIIIRRRIKTSCELKGKHDEYRLLADKVMASGYESLSSYEKRRFFELSATTRKR